MLDLAVKDWVRTWTAGSALNGSLIYLFGSVLFSTDPNDVDIIIVSPHWYINSLLSAIKREFKDMFKLPLHVQLFHASETARVESFLRKCGPFVEVK